MFKNFFSSKRTKGSSEQKPKTDKNTSEIIEHFRQSSDFLYMSIGQKDNHYLVSYFKSLVNIESLQRQFILKIQESLLPITDLESLKDLIPIEDITISSDAAEIQEKILQGYLFFQIHKKDRKGALIKVQNSDAGYRTENDTDNEFSVVGPKVGFVEDLDINLYLMRKEVVSEKLIMKEITVGSLSQTRVVITYLEGVTNPTYIETITQRLNSFEFDVVFDSSILDHAINDYSRTPFPTLLTSERLDRVLYSLTRGQVAIFSSGSPYAIIGPATLFDFFISPEDYYIPWIVGSFVRIIRIFGVFFSIFATPLYVAVVTYHYEMIPKDLLGPIIFSRTNVPFPPVIEVLFLEITIELLREAGARLPSKVGQTLGIVGGIVIGQATVEASLTSNILLILVSLTALASFTTPIFKMSNTIRLLRFPFIFFASFLGIVGITMGMAFMLAHLLRLKSLGNPYLVPFYPFRPTDYQDTFIRSPLNKLGNRPSFLRALSPKRYDGNSSKKKSPKKQNELDNE
ncbi:spore germination protein [Priestia koreensis]|uniref:spore germination protein n=2 Tax=Priestia koreensis TaxID=284581 RepID=UPI001F578B7C|nr:spore germination protein [Priestia koreensis]UNL85834.1 spore germination protein [Priestia koreensis]